MITRDEAMELTNELRIHIAKILGATDVVKSGGKLMGQWEGEWKAIPDYPNSLDAAWGLWRRLEEDRYIVAIENEVRGDMLLTCRGTGQAYSLSVFIRDKDSNPARAICRAFVIVEEDKGGA